MAGALEISRRNEGGLQVWTGDVVYRVVDGAERGFVQVPEVPGTGAMFSLDTRRPVDLTTTWIAGGDWSYIDAAAERIAEAGGIRVADECINTGTRAPATRLRRKIENLLPEMNEPLTLDFSGVHCATSSFLDELLGRLVICLGRQRFETRLRLTGMDSMLRRLANVVVAQRLGELDG
jgi:hypothetical protein